MQNLIRFLPPPPHNYFICIILNTFSTTVLLHTFTYTWGSTHVQHGEKFYPRWPGKGTLGAQCLAQRHFSQKLSQNQTGNLLTSSPTN